MGKKQMIVTTLASKRMNLPHFFISVNHAFGLAIMVYIIIIASTIIIMWDPLEIFHDSIGTGLLLGAATVIAVGVHKYQQGISLRNN
jgi:hypothetical protein